LRGCHRPADIDDGCRAYTELSGRRSDATALRSEQLGYGHGATRHRWPTNALSRRQGLRLPLADGSDSLKRQGLRWVRIDHRTVLDGPGEGS
jgi:hypothetical protein